MCAGVYLFCHGFLLLRRKRLIMNTPASKIRSAAMGLVEVSGLATGPYTVNAPITGKSCYSYRSTAWQWRRQGKNGHWEKVADESMHVPFFLDDNTGRVLVNPQGAELDIHRDFHEEFSQSLFSSSLDIPQNVAIFLSRSGVAAGRKLKVEEYCIKPKNALFILGTLGSNPGLSVSATPVRSVNPEPRKFSFNVFSVIGGLAFLGDVLSSSTMNLTMHRNEPALEEMILQSSSAAASSSPSLTQQGKIAAAMMKAGITNPTAWVVAGVNPSVAVTPTGTGSGAAAAVAPEQFDLHPATVLMKGAHNPAFFISWRSQRDVVKALGWKSTLMIWGGPALTMLCVYILAAEFGWL